MHLLSKIGRHRIKHALITGLDYPWEMGYNVLASCQSKKHLQNSLFVLPMQKSSTAPSYVTDMLHKKPLHTRNTRSISYTMPLLNRPAHSKATLGDRSFSFASSSVWNSIPNDVRCAPSLS